MIINEKRTKKKKIIHSWVFRCCFLQRQCRSRRHPHKRMQTVWALFFPLFTNAREKYWARRPMRICVMMRVCRVCRLFLSASKFIIEIIVEKLFELFQPTQIYWSKYKESYPLYMPQTQRALSCMRAGNTYLARDKRVYLILRTSSPLNFFSPKWAAHEDTDRKHSVTRGFFRMKYRN